MQNFAYKGRNTTGLVVNGVLEANSVSAAAELLAERSITPIEITPTQSSASPNAQTLMLRLFGERISHDEIMLFSRQLHTLLKAGVPIMRSLSSLEGSAANQAFVRVLKDLRQSLDWGRDLASSMSLHPKVFPPFYVSMVRVGELTGRLEEVFLRLYAHIYFECFMRDQVKAALRYPTFVIMAMVGAIIALNILVVPTFAKVFANLRAELPALTRFLITASDFTVNYWYMLLFAAVAAGFAFQQWRNTAEGRLRWDRFLLTAPIAGQIVRKAALARFARSLALASRSGVPIVEALSAVADTVDNTFIAARILAMRETIERGDTLLRAAVASGVFTPVVLQMIAVGEETCAVDTLMEEIADNYQREVEAELKTISARIEPILIIFLGILVTVLALGIFQPLWGLGKAALKR